MTTCPKCNFVNENPQATDCPKCGLIYAKFQKAKEDEDRHMSAERALSDRLMKIWKFLTVDFTYFKPRGGILHPS